VQVNISARHGHLSAGTQEKITDKVEKLRRLFDRVTAIQVTVDLEHEESPSVEVQVIRGALGGLRGSTEKRHRRLRCLGWDDSQN
jgi:ribosome-associated translation inhibitor RaiA